jgi:hypothetical protein
MTLLIIPILPMSRTPTTTFKKVLESDLASGIQNRISIQIVRISKRLEIGATCNQVFWTLQCPKCGGILKRYASPSKSPNNTILSIFLKSEIEWNIEAIKNFPQSQIKKILKQVPKNVV